MPSFAALAPAYAKLWAELVPTASHVPELEKICHLGISHKATYAEVAQKTWAGRADLWWVVFLLDQMEGGVGARTHLWNGDPLTHFTVNDPPGMPLVSVVGHGPPFTFVESAVPALAHDGLNKVTVWSAAAVGFYFEKYNGWGYLSKPIVDPYLASWSNKYTKGKWMENPPGHTYYDPEEVSQQPGALTILKVLLTLDSSIELPPDSTSSAPAAPKEKPPVTTTTTPAPVATTSLSLDFTTIEKQVEGVVATINNFGFLLPPPVKGILVFAPVGEGILTLIGKLQKTDWSHASIASVISSSLRDIAAAVDATVPPAAS